MLTQDNQIRKPIHRLAQLEAESDSPSVESAELPLGIALSDNTRLGPYSVLLQDAFEESQAEKILLLNETASDLDIVAIARSLTPAEMAQGLRQRLVTREKIALIVDVNNPFQGTLTLEQVAGIFRGEITNWSQVGGSDRPLTLINRPAPNATRQALEDYGLFDNTQLEASALDRDQDTTTEVVESLGVEGISYAPASETIEQFNIRVITIDNVGVDDARYPFSIPLNYVYRTPPKPEVQEFLDFLESPDAQAAIEFAQSQPADPTRSLDQAARSPLQGQLADVSPSNQSDSSSTESGLSGSAIPATPLDPPPVTNTTEEVPSPLAPPKADSGDLSWIPLVLIFLVMGILGWLTYMRVTLEKKRKNTPRPAPDYAARLGAQGSNRDMDELRAIAEGPAKAKAAAQSSTPSIPDLSFDDTTIDAEEDPQSYGAEASDGLKDAELWEEDQTTIQGATVDSPATEEDDVDMTMLQTAESAPSTSAAESEDIELHAETDEDVTVLQGVFEAESEELEDLADMTILQDDSHTEEPQRDPLTGQLTEELEALSELEAEARNHSVAEAQPSPSGEAANAEPHPQSDSAWEEMADPWD